MYRFCGHAVAASGTGGIARLKSEEGGALGQGNQAMSSEPQQPGPAMTDGQETAGEPPRWLVWFFWSSLASAAMAGTLLLWAKWGLALSMAQDLWKYCF